MSLGGRGWGRMRSWVLTNWDDHYRMGSEGEADKV